MARKLTEETSPELETPRTAEAWLDELGYQLGDNAQPGELNEAELSFVWDSLLGDAIKAHDCNPEIPLWWNAEHFTPFWHVMTNGFRPDSTELLLYRMGQELPWIPRSEAVDGIKEAFHSYTYHQSEATLSERQRASYEAYMEDLARKAARAGKAKEVRTAGKADFEPIPAPSAAVPTPCSPEAGEGPKTKAQLAKLKGELDVDASLYKGLAEMLKDYFEVPGKTSGEKDLRLAYAFRYGEPLEGKKLAFIGSPKGLATYFAKELFLDADLKDGKFYKTFSECFETGLKNLGSKSTGRAKRPEVLADRRLTNFVEECKAAREGSNI